MTEPSEIMWHQNRLGGGELFPRAAKVAASVLVGSVLAGCGAEQATTGRTRASPSPRPTATLEVRVSRPGEDAKIPNPGTGTADPRLTAALLPSFQTGTTVSIPDPPGAAVRFPVRDKRSLFIPTRQVSSPYSGAPECTKWTAGMWAALLTGHNTTGVQLAVSMLSTSALPLRPEDLKTPGHQRQRTTLTFSEAIIAAPPQVINALADDRRPSPCTRLTGTRLPDGRIETIPTARLGNRSWAYRILDTKGKIWHWVQIVQFNNYLLEIRIPNQEPGPNNDMTTVLHQITTTAHTRATTTLH